MERPTVGTRVGGIPDMVIDGKTGVLVNPADPEDLARGILELLRDPERAKALGKAGRRHVLETATLSRTVADLDRLYRRCLFPGGKRRSGYRWWVTALRLPVVAVMSARLNQRLVLLEYYYLPRWERGWRPWQLRALICLPVEIVGLTLLSLAPRAALTSAYRLCVRVWPRLRGIAVRDELRTGQGAVRRSAGASAVGA
jgi:hypothetical protein